MLVNVNGLLVKLLGDPHMGKSFINGTPLARRGERENMQWQDFVSSLNDLEGAKVHIMMGDLFDQWTVPYRVIFQVAQFYKSAAEANPTVDYYLINGNHDLSKDMARVSAFRILEAILENHPGITVVSSTPQVAVYGAAKLALIPWNPIHNTADLVRQHQDDLDGASAAFGHWDVVAVSDTSNLVPSDELLKLGVKKAYTGHDHTRREVEIAGLPVTVVGSMQPYSFGEDPAGKLYVTIDAEDLADYTDDQLVGLRNKCVRVMMDRGAKVEKVPDALMFKVQYRDQPDVDEDLQVEVSLGDFSFDRVFNEVMSEGEVGERFVSLTKIRIDEERAKQ